MNINEFLNAREEYISSIKAELLGPGSEVSVPDVEHEIITNPPDVRYSIGVLFSKNNKLNADNDDSARVEESVTVSDEVDLTHDDSNNDDTDKTDIKTPPEEDNLDEEIGLAAQNMPSSLGMTFLVPQNINNFKCKVSFGTYKHAMLNDCRYPFSPEDPESYTVPMELAPFIKFDKEHEILRLTARIDKRTISLIKERDILTDDEPGIFSALYKLSDQLQKGYVRVPHEVEVLVDFSAGDYTDNNKDLDGTKAKVTALKRKINDSLYSITVMLVNDDDEKSNATRCIFQPLITVDSKQNEFTFSEYSALTDFNLLDTEEQSLALQYRNKKVYGTGLGTSINWRIDGNGNGTIFNDFFPEVEVPSMDFSIPSDSGIDKVALSMRFLSDLDSTERNIKINKLETVLVAYEKWVSQLIMKAGDLENKYVSAADLNIHGCKVALDRMRSGLRLLSSNDIAWSAFELANRAMFMQRVHLDLQAVTSKIDRYPDDDELSNLIGSIDYSKIEGITDDKHFWRLFQISFLIMTVNSIVSDYSEDRNLVDLIWFPTGGGKTEAYLGLTAFTIFYRRLANLKESDGTAVIMRYTLRLLAAQQFTRASTLICACEYIRNDSSLKKSKFKSYPLGEKEINIGLWIGRNHTPNSNKDASMHLKKLNDAQPYSLHYAMEQHNKFQVLKCPWCGTKMIKGLDGKKAIGRFGYRMVNNRRFEMFCPQENCFFSQHGKLPIQIIDEELYDNPPTLLFGTVDKFAMIPWKEEIGTFFAVNSTNRAPELIIQDELHLISGPLGTMVGLYETIIDSLCRSKNIGPKIVASTATIRRAKEQCSALYNRAVTQFPHPGLDAEDSFFAREAAPDYSSGVYGRKYVGLMPSGKTKAMMEVRSIAALMQKIHTMDLPDQVKDKYWTLTVYFNSLKDLGKCSNLVDDDVKDFIKRTAYRLGDGRDARLIARADELTSRVTTTQLNETLDKLEKLNYSRENLDNRRYPANILLATNMISVGIDVARLNVMLLVGQPKLTSEYIQASSRIGRSYPGVAFVMYDGSKSRDRSHYEQFKPYHESFYKYVEPTGATPFSKPARDRALHAVLVAMLRMLEPELTSETGAANFEKIKYADRISEIKNFILKRSTEITQRLNSNMKIESTEIAHEIDDIFDDWERLANNYDKDHFFYGEKFMFALPDDNNGRLLKPFNTSRGDGAYETMTSMRNVDSTVKGNVLIWEDE